MMKVYQRQQGVPCFSCIEYSSKMHDYVILIPIINEGDRIYCELERAKNAGIPSIADIVICDGGSTDGSITDKTLLEMEVNTLLIKNDTGKQGAQLRMGVWWALKRGYKGIITIDGNNKDNIENVPKFIEKLKQGYDYIQGSRFIKGGKAINTPWIRYFAVRFIHAPIISLSARHWFTDTTNAYRGYSNRYLSDIRVNPLRDIFKGYELLAYLSIRASRLGYKVCEIPVVRKYPKDGIVPTKITSFKGKINLLIILFENFLGKYNP